MNSASGFGPVFFYSHVLAFLAGYVPLHVAMAVLWLFAFIAVILVTAFTAKDVTGSVLGGMIAAILITLSAPFAWAPRRLYSNPRSYLVFLPCHSACLQFGRESEINQS